MIPDLHSTNPLARIMSRLERLEKAVQENASTSRTLEATTIGKGGLILAQSGMLQMLDELDRQLAYFRDGGAVFTDPTTGSRMQFYRGQIRFWDSFDDSPTNFGRIVVDPGAGRNMFRMFPPYDAGSGLENSFTMRGKTADQAGAMWWYTDGVALMTAAKIGLNPTGGVVSLYNLPTTSGGYLMRYNLIGGDWTLALDSSSLRYKDNVRPVDREYAATVLEWEPSWFQMLDEIDRVGADEAPWYLGFIAEQIAEHTPEVVVHDEQGRPDALNKADMVAGLHILAQVQQEQLEAQGREIAELKGTVATQADAIADLTARLEALESARG